MIVSSNDDEVLILTLLGQENMDQMRKGKAKKSFRIELITNILHI